MHAAPGFDLAAHIEAAIANKHETAKALGWTSPTDMTPLGDEPKVPR